MIGYDRKQVIARLGIRELTIELSRRKFLEFCCFINPNFIVAEHHRAIGRRLQAMVENRTDYANQFLYVGMPPRHGKSEMMSVLFPAWFLGLFPHLEIIHLSYAAHLSNEFSRRVREIVRANLRYKEVFPRVQLHPERQRVDDWRTIQGGGFLSLGAGAGLEGHGGDLIIKDDPHSGKDAESMATLDEKWEWYLRSVRSRLHPHGIILMPATRQHPLDIPGRALDLSQSDPESDQWDSLVLPAIAEEGDELGREVGEALWPSRFPLKTLETLRAASARIFDTVYQQKPRAVDSKLFDAEKFKMVPLARPPVAAGVWAFDLALTKNEAADYSAYGRGTFYQMTKRLRVWNPVRERLEWPEMKAKIHALIRMYPKDVFAFPKNLLELMAVQQLRSEAPGARIVEVPMKGDKRERAGVYSDVVAKGRAVVSFDREHEQMARLFVQEHDAFTGVADSHDDFVDMTSVLAHYFGLDRQVQALESLHGLRVDPVADVWERM